MTGEEMFALTLCELQDVAMLHYADNFDEMEYKAETAGQVPHRIDGTEGRWYWVSNQQNAGIFTCVC